MGTPANALNITAPGLVRFDGVNTFSGVTTTQHDLLIGAASNGITSVAPSATSGVPVISQGASADPTFGTAAIAGGGTNATSFSTTNGIVTYDGTRLVSSTQATISSGVYTNTGQVGGTWDLTNVTTNFTGDGTVATVPFNHQAWQQGNNFNTTTGVYTVPNAGKYIVSGMITFNNLSGVFNAGEVSIKSSAGVFTRQLFNPGLVRDSSNNTCIPFSAVGSYAASDTIYVDVKVSGGTKIVGIKESSFGAFTYFSIMKVA